MICAYLTRIGGITDTDREEACSTSLEFIHLCTYERDNEVITEVVYGIDVHTCTVKLAKNFSRYAKTSGCTITITVEPLYKDTPEMRPPPLIRTL